MFKISLSFLAAAMLLPCLAQATDNFELRELGGCQLPIVPGAQVASEVSNSFEEGNLVLATRTMQHSVFWFPGANSELTAEVLGLYADALSGSGAWLGTDETTWVEVDGEKAARLPVKVSGEDQETPGLMLMWASVQTGRYFMYILTPATGSKVDLGALIDEAAGAVSCAGAGKVQEPVAVFDPTPAGWWRDESDAPRIMYGRRDNKQTVLIWSSKRSSSKYDCAEPAQTLFDRFLDDPKLSQAGESRTEVDNSDGSAEGAVLCRVQADVSGWSEAEGDRILYTQWICSGREDRTVASLEILAGDLGEAYLNPRDHAVCLDEVPEEVAEELQETPPEEKTQWVPPKQETKEKKKKKKK